MRTIPVLAALFISIVGLSMGTVAVPTTADPAANVPAQVQGPDQAPNASFDRLVLAEASGTMTVDEVTMDRLETDQGTVENVTLEEATVTVEDATVVVSNVSTEDGDIEHAFVSIEAGSVTVEEATATANGAEFSVDEVNVTVENESRTSGGPDDVESLEMRVDPDEVKQLVEGAEIEELSVSGVSADASIELASVDGVEVENRSGFVYVSGATLDSFEDASVAATSASLEDGTLVLEDAEMTVEDAQASVDISVVGMDDDTRALDNIEVDIDGPVTFERDEIRIPLW